MIRIIPPVLALLFLPGCCLFGLPPAKRLQPAAINHVVFFKLKDAAASSELIKVCYEKIPAIPGVARFYCGRHLDTGRATVDSEYDVGLYVGFDSLKDYQAYVDHPDHIALVEEWKPRWEWIKVYDVQDDHWRGH